MTYKHTTGPWKVTLAGVNSQGFYTHQIGTNDKTVCYTWSPNECYAGEQQANARLIASAPEMLRALEEAEAELYQVPPADDEQLRVLEIVRTAITKAKGIAR